MKHKQHWEPGIPQDDPYIVGLMQQLRDWGASSDTESILETTEPDIIRDINFHLAVDPECIL